MQKNVDINLRMIENVSLCLTADRPTREETRPPGDAENVCNWQAAIT